MGPQLAEGMTVPGLYADKLCVHILPSLQGPLPCTRTHVVAHESPWMTNMWMKFFIPHPVLEDACHRVLAPNQNSFTDRYPSGVCIF